MRISGLVFGTVLDADVIAVAAIGPGLHDGAVAGGVDRRPGGRREVDALVHLRIAEDGMAALAVAGRQARAVHRCAQQGLAHRFAGSIVVVGVAARIRIAVNGDRGTRKGQAGVENVAVAHRPPLLVHVAFEHYFETVARLDVTLEVDVVGEGADHLDKGLHRNAGLARRFEEAGLDGAAEARELARRLVFDLTGGEAVCIAPGADLTVGLGVQRNAPEGAFSDAIGRAFEGDRHLLADLQIAWVVDLPQRGDGLMRLGAAHAGALQQVHQGIAAVDLNHALDRP